MNKNLIGFAASAPLNQIAYINGFKFTPKEIDNVSCLINGRSIKKAATILEMSPRTAETHIRNVMKKLEVNSREGIIDFIEKSAQCSFIKEHYNQLIIQHHFHNLLKNVAMHIEKKGLLTCSISFQKEQKDEKEFADKISKDLSLAGIKIVKGKTSHSTYQLYIIRNSEDIRLHSSSIFYLQLQDLNVNSRNYYLSFLFLLQKLVPTFEWKRTIAEFEKTYTSQTMPSKTAQPVVFFHKLIPQFFYQSKISKIKRVCILTCLSFFFLLIGSIIYVTFFPQNKIENIYSDLLLPSKSHLLERRELLTKIKVKSKNANQLPIIVLVGIGGAGKTTLARQYSLSESPSLIWELNAERPDTFLTSLENLGHALAKTSKEKGELRNILEINHSPERGKKLFSFINNFLKAHKNWILVYDNVESFNDIKNYIPTDPYHSKAGQIIITTRNENLNSPLIDPDKIIHIDELSTVEKLSLFTNILSNQANTEQNETTEVQEFLKSIPSFPLDVSTAAHYIRATNTPLNKYLEFISKQDQDFLKIEEGIQKESSDYDRTRHKIMAVSLQKLLQENSQFGELLYFISLLDSQNIPTEMMYYYKNGAIVDNLIYHLKKYSLISSDPKETSLINPTFSMHRAVQRGCFSYLNNSPILHNKHSILNTISLALIDYSKTELNKNPIRKYEIKKAKLLTQHGLAFLKNKRTLESSHKFIPGTTAEIIKYLGVSYRDLGNFEKSKELFIKSYQFFKKRFGPDSIQAAEALGNLGVTYGFLGEYKKAQNCYKIAYPLYEKHYGKNHTETGWLSVHFGNNYRDLGKYNEAKRLYEKSYSIFFINYGKSHSTTAWVLGNLGDVYRRLGYLEKAKELLHQCVEIFKNDTFRHVWGLIHLSKVYSDLHLPREAKSYLEESLALYSDYYGENNIKNAWLYLELGNVEIQLSHYNNGKKLLDKAFSIFNENYDENHPALAQTLQGQALYFLDKSDLTQAEEVLLKALHITQKNEHPEIYKIYETLAEIEKRRGHRIKHQAYLNLALKTISTHFSQDSPHFLRLQFKLSQMKEDT